MIILVIFASFNMYYCKKGVKENLILIIIIKLTVELLIWISGKC